MQLYTMRMTIKREHTRIVCNKNPVCRGESVNRAVSDLHIKLPECNRSCNCCNYSNTSNDHSLHQQQKKRKKEIECAGKNVDDFSRNDAHMTENVRSDEWIRFFSSGLLFYCCCGF